MRKSYVFGAIVTTVWLGSMAPAIAATTTTTYQYDALGRLIGVVNPDGSTITYAYDAAGNRTQLTVTGSTTPPKKVVVLPLLGGLVIPLK